MKTTSENLDDLIFENRNKAYGAYDNRKNYNKYMLWALSAAISLFLLVISVPVIANYLEGGNYTGKDITVSVDTLVVINKPDKPPVLPEVLEPRAKDLSYARPRPVFDTLDVVDLGDLMAEVKNPPAVNDTHSFYIPEDIKGPEKVIETAKPEEFLIVEEMPEFPGGDAGRMKYLSEHVKYPMAARTTGIEGDVYVTFVVDESGNVLEPALLRGIGGGCDEEALRVIGEMPKWKPGRQSGREVRVRFSLAISFKLR